MNFLSLNHTIAFFLASAVTFFVGIFIFFRSRDKMAINRKYAYSMLCVSWWSFFNGLSLMTNDPSKFILFQQISFLSAIFISTSKAHFIILFLDIKRRKWFIRIAYILSLFLVATSFSPYTLVKAAPTAYLNYCGRFQGANKIMNLKQTKEREEQDGFNKNRKIRHSSS